MAQDFCSYSRQADRIAKMMNIDIDFQIIPFIGVHLTRMIGGFVTIGPNAVLGWKREGYGCFNISLKDSFDMIAFPGFWKVIMTNLMSGIKEFKDSFYKSGYLERVRKYCPDLAKNDLLSYPAGIRAQAVKKIIIVSLPKTISEKYS